MKKDTEKRLSQKFWIDQMNVETSLKFMLENQKEAFFAIKESLKSIKLSVNKITKKLHNSNNSRLIYVGAGTSARIAVQDGAELLPTFNWPKNRVKFVIAGGTQALVEAKENAEDDNKNVMEQLTKINLNSNDCVIAISASGKTLFTVEALNEAKKRNCLTIGISNNSNTPILFNSDCPILLNTGSEAVAGSTRLKAGTAQKICLNLISTQVMTNLGKIKNGMMIFMKPRNEKLRIRKRLIEKTLENDDNQLFNN